MTPSQRLDRARECFRAFCESPASNDESPWRETVYIADGFYVGRRFIAGNVAAIWFTEEDQLKVYDSAGELRASFTGDEMSADATAEVRRAA